jgi:hypothetical protein
MGDLSVTVLLAFYVAHIFTYRDPQNRHVSIAPMMEV